MAFSAFYNIDYKTTTVEHVLAFIQYTRPRMRCPASIRNMVGSLATAFKRAGLDPSVFASFRVHNALKSIDINSRYIPTTKLPITPEQLERVIRKMRAGGRDPAIICAIAFSFTGLFGQSNLAPQVESKFDASRHLTRGDVTRTPAGLRVNIKWTKTIQRAQDATSILLPSIPGRALCPVVALDTLIISSPTVSKCGPLFATAQGRPLCLGLLKRAWKETLIQLGMPQKSLSLHSLRSGGATAVWGTGKVSEHDLMQHGTWSSAAWRGYVRPTAKGSTITTALQQLSK